MVNKLRMSLPLRMVRNVCVPGLCLAMGCVDSLIDTESATAWEIPVLVLAYHPIDGDVIDINVTGDWGESLAVTRRKVDSLTTALAASLSDGTKYRAYANDGAQPSLHYQVVGMEERLQPLPTWAKPGHTVPMTDYRAIAEAFDVVDWVERRGVKEIWLWGYHGGVVDLWESNMAGPWGDISNSDRDPDDLPIAENTYTFYHYNYQRGLSEAAENHMHQLEAVINFVDGRDDTPEDEWSSLLFWGKFVGSDISHRIIDPRCGWSHYPPNGEHDYDWANPRTVSTDCEDWQPDGSGVDREVTCDTWGCSSLGWFRYWTQNIPGAGNDLEYEGRPLTNWWRLIGDFDGAMREDYVLVSKP
jgi:hypothetical protein